MITCRQKVVKMTNNLPNFTSPLSVRRMFAPCKNTVKPVLKQLLERKKMHSSNCDNCVFGLFLLDPEFDQLDEYS